VRRTQAMALAEAITDEKIADGKPKFADFAKLSQR
jgi:hypothetical protein